MNFNSGLEATFKNEARTEENYLIFTQKKRFLQKNKKPFCKCFKKKPKVSPKRSSLLKSATTPIRGRKSIEVRFFFLTL